MPPIKTSLAAHVLEPVDAGGFRQAADGDAFLHLPIQVDFAASYLAAAIPISGSNGTV